MTPGGKLQVGDIISFRGDPRKFRVIERMSGDPYAIKVVLADGSPLPGQSYKIITEVSYHMQRGVITYHKNFTAITPLADVFIDELGRGKSLMLLRRLARIPGDADFQRTMQLLYKEINNRGVEDTNANGRQTVEPETA
jgi:hypothetical protein